jgi:peroxiredoxin
MHDRRISIPICAAITLVVVCTWRVATNKHQDYADQVAVAVVMRPAPGFEALDSDNHLFRLGTYLGRHKIIVVFFDGETGVNLKRKLESGEQEETVDLDHVRKLLADLIRLRDRFGELQSHNVKVVAVSASIPQRNRASMQCIDQFPFPLVSDFDPTAPEGALRIHRQWGRLDVDTGKPRTGVFLIDRKGQVLFGVDGPKPKENIDQAIDEAIK